MKRSDFIGGLTDNFYTILYNKEGLERFNGHGLDTSSGDSAVLN